MAAPSLAGLVAFSHFQVSQIRGRQPYSIVRNFCTSFQDRDGGTLVLDRRTRRFFPFIQRI
jgi:hypothetical protein